MFLGCVLLIRLTFRLPRGIGEPLIFKQKLDHFDPTDREMFNQTYAVTDEFVDYSKPMNIILYISGEQDMNSGVVSRLSVTEVAKRTNSRIAALEHRFYGNSVPRPLTTENLRKYLTTAQALEDLASFTTFLKENCSKNQNSDCRVLIVGGSYAGSLSSFFRQKYPHLAAWSWSSSPPLDIKNNFSEYDAHMADVLDTLPHNCRNQTRELMRYFEHLVMGNETEYEKLGRDMCLNESTDPVSRLSMLADAIAGMIQYRNRMNGTLEEYCANQSRLHPDSFLAYVRADCGCENGNECDENDDLLLTDTSPDSDMVDARSWTWQTCNEYGWFQTASGRLRSSFVNLSYSERVCQTLFDGTGLANQSSVRIRYGGVNPKTTNIVFVNGGVDPWSVLSVNFTSGSVNGDLICKILNG